MWEWSGRPFFLPARIGHVPPDILSQIFAAASLELIQLPGVIEKEHHGGFDYWGSDRCFINHERAILIRTYHQDGVIFTHCRSYTAHVSHISDGVIHRSEHVWEEHTDFNGSLVPASSLSEVYQVLGESVAWTRPGRDLGMPNAAWDVLWRSAS